MTIQEIREYLAQFFEHVELVGTAEGSIAAPAKVESAKAGEVTFIANEKYLRYLSETSASLVIVHRSVDVSAHAGERSFLKVSDPYTAFVFVLQTFARPRTLARPGVAPSAVLGEGVSIAEDARIGEYAVIGDRSSVGRGTTVAPHAVVMHDVRIGRECTIFPHVTIYDGTVIGDRVVVHAGTVIGADGFGFAPQPDGSYVKIPQMGIVEIGDDAEIGANATIDRATMGSTVIAKGVKIDNLVQVAHNCRIGEHTVVAAQAGISGSTIMGRGCMIGGQAGFAGHLELADRTHVAAQAGVSKSFLEPGTAIRGYPAQPMRDQLRHEAMLRHLGSMKEKIDRIDKVLKERGGTEE